MNTNSETQHPASLPLCVRVCAIDLPCCYHWHGYVVRTMTVCSDRDVAPLAYLLDLCVVPLPIPAVAMRACQCAAALALTPISSASGLGGKGRAAGWHRHVKPSVRCFAQFCCSQCSTLPRLLCACELKVGAASALWRLGGGLADERQRAACTVLWRGTT